MSLTPYYQDRLVTLYLGKAEEVAPQLEPVDLCLTDPPYGINRDGSRPSTSQHGGRKAYEFRGWDSGTPGPDAFEAIFQVSKHQIIWGANYFTRFLPPSMGWLVWDKGQRIQNSDAELAFTSFDAALRVITLNRVELLLDGAKHPTQKPVKLGLACIAHAEKFMAVNSVLDCYAGSGSFLKAAKQLGKTAIGIEKDEWSAEIIINRLSQDTFDFQPA